MSIEFSNFSPQRQLIALSALAATVFSGATIEANHASGDASSEARRATPVVALYSAKYDKLSAEGHADLQPKDVVLGPGEAHLSEVMQTGSDELAKRNRLLLAIAAELVIAGAAELLHRRRDHLPVDAQIPPSVV